MRGSDIVVLLVILLENWALLLELLDNPVDLLVNTIDQ
jgi:hypothetical protein